MSGGFHPPRETVVSKTLSPAFAQRASAGGASLHVFAKPNSRLFGTVSLCNKLQTQNIVMLESPYPLPYEQVHAGQDTARPNFGSTHQFTRLYSSSSFDPTRSRRHQ